MRSSGRRGYLQNRSMEYQTGAVKCEGNRHIFPGMRITVKNVGDYFSGEYIAERVVHELSVCRGFTTEVYMRRNRSGRQQRSVSVLDSERLQTREGAVSGDASEEEREDRLTVYEEEGGSEDISNSPTIPFNAASNLIAAQDKVMSNPIYREGGGGPFGNSTGSETWCNQATFEIVRNTSALRLANVLYGSGPNGYNTTANMAAENLMNAATGRDSSIMEITPQEAQKLANKGYTVVAAWKNPSGSSGHMATVRPGNTFDELTGPMLNNIGAARTTGIRTTIESFSASSYANGEVHFYYDFCQFECKDREGI